MVYFECGVITLGTYLLQDLFTPKEVERRRDRDGTDFMGGIALAFVAWPLFWVFMYLHYFHNHWLYLESPLKIKPYEGHLKEYWEINSLATNNRLDGGGSDHD